MKDLFNQDKGEDLTIDQPPVIYENKETPSDKQTNWSIPDENGNIDMPDELEPLFNKLGFQLRFHTISGKGEIETLAAMTYIAQKFFNDLNKKV